MSCFAVTEVFRDVLVVELLANGSAATVRVESGSSFDAFRGESAATGLVLFFLATGFEAVVAERVVFVAVVFVAVVFVAVVLEALVVDVADVDVADVDVALFLVVGLADAPFFVTVFDAVFVWAAGVACLVAFFLAAAFLATGLFFADAFSPTVCFVEREPAIALPFRPPSPGRSTKPQLRISATSGSSENPREEASTLSAAV